MKIPVVPIGNSRGIRIPKTILDQMEITDQVDLEVEGNRILLTPVRKKPREGWEEAFQNMHDRGEDRLILKDAAESSDSEFEWEW